MNKRLGGIKIGKRRKILLSPRFPDVSPTPEEETLLDFDAFDNDFFVYKG